MRNKLATLIHINPMKGVTPLAGGYLKTYAELDRTIARTWDIELYSQTTDCPASRIIGDLVARSPNLVGFSTYVWNIGLVQRILSALRGVLPQDTLFLLGGVQVMNNASCYVDPTWENVLVCNGEGEKTFRELLSTGATESKDFRQVGGITYHVEGKAITTDPHARIKDLNEIPSPFLADVFEPKDLGFALLETNRGCPYHCDYCYWGGAIGQKINRLSEDRVRAEIAYLAGKRCGGVLLCDANFGIFPQDIEIAREFVSAKQQTGYPLRVTYSSAKNNPERSSEVATIFAQGGVMSCQPISLQTMNPNALALASRGNISTDTYLHLQRRMNDLGVASFIEIIWPLPGETLETFKDGLSELCEMGAQAFGVYPLLWLKNVGFEGKEHELGIVVLDEADPVGGGQIVIQTKEVTFEQWIEGMMYVNSVMLLYDCRGLFHTAGILNALGIATYRSLFDRFVDWLTSASKNSLVDLWNHGRQNFEEMYKYTWRGAVVEAVLHTNRGEFDAMLSEFVIANPDLFAAEHADLIAAAVDFDIVSRPYAYGNTPVGVEVDTRRLTVSSKEGRSFVVQSPFDIPKMAHALSTGGAITPDDLKEEMRFIKVDHDRGQIFRMPYRRDEDHHQYCHQFVTEIGNHTPVYSAVPCKTVDPTAVSSDPL